jgi:hypothetical protein
LGEEAEKGREVVGDGDLDEIRGVDGPEAAEMLK